jgi:ubiquinone/menaquinone biosynthesis C-methylase UbiE
MLNLKRFLLYSSWMKNEMFSNKSMAHVYDIAATENDYDVAIRYEKRKAIFKKLLTPYDFNNKSVLDLACGTGVFLDSIQAKQLKRCCRCRYFQTNANQS